MTVCSSVSQALIIEHHSPLAEEISALVTNHPVNNLIGVQDDGFIYESYLRLTPNIILLDMYQLGMRGTEYLKEKIRIMVITASTTGQKQKNVSKSIKRKTNSICYDLLLIALQRAAHDKVYIDSALRLDTDNSGLTPLTPRELQILKLIAEGKRNRNISEQLFISLKTVETHRLNLMRKLDAHNAVELCNWALKLGITEF